MRPTSIWITQILLCFFGLMFFFIWGFNTFVVVKREGFGVLTAKFIIFTTIIFTLVSLFAVSFWGMMKRKVYGKWCGAASIFIIWIILLASQLASGSGPIKPYEYSNVTQRVSGLITQGVIHLLFLVLIYKLGFAKNISSFLNEKTPNTSNLSTQ